MVRSLRPLVQLAFPFLLATFFGCGGNVVVDGTESTGGQGGGGSSTTTSITSPTTGTTTTTTTTTGIDDPKTYCLKACKLLEQYGCSPGPSCASDCAQSLVDTPSECFDEFFAYVDCYLASIPQSGCDNTAPCQSEVDAYVNCVSNGTLPCGPVGCTGSENFCSCNGTCNGQARQVDCEFNGSQGKCSCYLSGNFVGSCAEFGNLCDIENGCCAPFFQGGE